MENKETTPDARWDRVFSEGKEFTTLNEVFINEILLPKLTPADEKSEKRFLDVGCGAGDALRKMGRRGFAVNGIDISSVAIEKVKKLLGAQSGQFVVANIEHANFEEFTEKFDLILIKLVIAFIVDKKAVLERLKKKLHANGALLIITPILCEGITYTKKHTLGISVQQGPFEEILRKVFPSVETIHKDYTDDNMVIAYYLCRL